MQRSDQINELAAALSQAQGKMHAASKDSANPFFNSKYADLASCWEAIREPLAEVGLAVSQVSEGDGKCVTVITLLLHSSGQWISGQCSAVPMRQEKFKGWVESPDPQTLGSTNTYLRRYGLMSIVGIAPADDDGNAASGRHRHEEDESQEEQHPENRRGRQQQKPPPTKPAETHPQADPANTPGTPEYIAATVAKLKSKLAGIAGDRAKLAKARDTVPTLNIPADVKDDMLQEVKYLDKLAELDDWAKSPKVEVVEKCNAIAEIQTKLKPEEWTAERFRAISLAAKQHLLDIEAQANKATEQGVTA